MKPCRGKKFNFESPPQLLVQHHKSVFDDRPTSRASRLPKPTVVVHGLTVLGPQLEHSAHAGQGRRQKMHSGLPPLPRGQQRRADVNNSRSVKRGIRGVKDGVRSTSQAQKRTSVLARLVSQIPYEEKRQQRRLRTLNMHSRNAT